MKLAMLSERRRQKREWIRLFHGTALGNIKSILKTGLDRGDLDRSYFGPSPALAYGGAYEEHEEDKAFALVEVAATKRHHEMSGYTAGGDIRFDTPLGQRVKHFEDTYDREELLLNPALEKERRQYQAALSRYTKKYGVPAGASEVDFPVPIAFSGNPKIIAIYIVSLPSNIVGEVIYGAPGMSFKVGDRLSKAHKKYPSKHLA